MLFVDCIGYIASSPHCVLMACYQLKSTKLGRSDWNYLRVIMPSPPLAHVCFQDELGCVLPLPATTELSLARWTLPPLYFPPPSSFFLPPSSSPPPLLPFSSPSLGEWYLLPSWCSLTAYFQAINQCKARDNQHEVLRCVCVCVCVCVPIRLQLIKINDFFLQADVGSGWLRLYNSVLSHISGAPPSYLLSSLTEAPNIVYTGLPWPTVCGVHPPTSWCLLRKKTLLTCLPSLLWNSSCDQSNMFPYALFSVRELGHYLCQLFLCHFSDHLQHAGRGL